MQVGLMYLAGYILLVGVATFLQKFSMRTLSPFQLHFLISIGMLLTAVPALFLSQKSLSVPLKGVPLGGFIGVSFALGSLLYVLAISKMPVGVATVISLSYVLVVLILSTVFLGEKMDLIKIIGMIFTIVGVVILSLRQA